MSQRFDYRPAGDFRTGTPAYEVFDRKGEAGSDQPLATCVDRRTAELLVAALRQEAPLLEGLGRRSIMVARHHDLGC